MKFGRTRNAVETRADRRVFSQLFRIACISYDTSKTLLELEGSTDNVVSISELAGV